MTSPSDDHSRASRPTTKRADPLTWRGPANIMLRIGYNYASIAGRIM